MSTVGAIAVIAALFLGYEALKLFQGSKSATPVAASGSSSSGSSGGASIPQGGYVPSIGRLLPASWYAAIQANESTLPLPGPNDPEPMFGFIPGAPGNVGTGYYSSGGSAAASASLGVGAGQTAQSLFPDVQTGLDAFDSLISKIPGALDAARTGDFAFFLRTIAPSYAGPGEVQGWPTQVLSHYNPNATFPTVPAG